MARNCFGFLAKTKPEWVSGKTKKYSRRELVKTPTWEVSLIQNPF